MYYLILLLAGSIFVLGLNYIKKPFFSFAKAATSHLDTMLDSSMEELEKSRLILKKVGALLVKMVIFVSSTFLLLIIAFIPVWVYTLYFEPPIPNQWLVFLSLTLPAGLLLIPRNSTDSDYSDWSILLHEIVLDNYNIGRALLKWELTKVKEVGGSQFVIVSGLARSGTTAITNYLYESGKFHSLSYQNMPFLLAPRLWKKIYNPKKVEKRERAHGDQVLFGLDSVEALEEYFFKAFLEDEFIKPQTLEAHEISHELYQKYLKYQQLIAGKEQRRYLAKNNNMILRFASLRNLNPHFYAVIMLRDPIDHANSLLKQHQRFTQLQKGDPFVLQYMNWLGHHEFGLNHKSFDWGQGFESKHDPNGLTYWLEVWVNYYQHIQSIVSDENLLLIDYDDLLHQPKKLMGKVSEVIELEVTLSDYAPFKGSDKTRDVDVEAKLKEKADRLYQDLLQSKLVIGGN